MTRCVLITYYITAFLLISRWEIECVLQVFKLRRHDKGKVNMKITPCKKVNTKFQ